MSQVKLIQPTKELREQYISFYKEWLDSGEEIYPWVVEKDPYDFNAYVDFLYSQDSEAKLGASRFVPHTTYWLVNEEMQIAGAVNIRHRLNDKLLKSGGHIGFGICPSCRRQGYATALLRMALEKTKELDMERVLVVCDRGNIGSEKTIVNNGGKFESEFIEEDGNVVRRFWIDFK